MAATLFINYHSASHFTTENAKEARAQPMLMTIQLVDGPFRRLDGVWRFKGLVGFGVQDRIRTGLQVFQPHVRKVIGPVFSHIANSFVDAFVRRASQVYGDPA